jgi:phosphoribosylformylglycinamidine cyclo-ligase
MKEPVLVSGTDGVGTKQRIAQLMGKLDTVGIDCVAMCVNDVICCGAKPLFFLDYIACGKNIPGKIAEIVKGVAEGCVQSGCALIGGETAEMPGFYGVDEYDLAGFSVGVVDREKVLDNRTIKAGDAIIGLPSSGFHSNGFSLVRKVVFSLSELNVFDTIQNSGTELDGQLVGEVLLTPTRIYVKPAMQILENFREAVHGVAHITGGGLHENLERVVPAGSRVLIDRGSWTVKPVFRWIQKLGEIEEDEMYRVFNMGLGLVMVLAADQVEAIRATLDGMGLENWIIGKVVEGQKAVVWND